MIGVATAAPLSTGFPVGTLVVNVAGSFLIGALLQWGGGAGILSTEWRLFLATGFCGGFTTFSAFSFETITLVQAGRAPVAATYVLASVVLSIAACLGGFYLARSI
jgi:CrcB protein